MKPSTARTLAKVLLWVGGGCLLLAMPCVFFGVLGLFGVVADVSPAENRSIGVRSLLIATVPAGLGLLLLPLGLVMMRKREKPD